MITIQRKLIVSLLFLLVCFVYMATYCQRTLTQAMLTLAARLQKINSIINKKRNRQ
jgi:hypothetical protein